MHLRKLKAVQKKNGLLFMVRLSLKMSFIFK